MIRILTEFQQWSVSWFNAKLGIPTASEFAEFMTTEFQLRTGKQIETYLYEKLAERITKKPLPNAFSSWSVERGQILEEEARPFFEMQTGMDTRAVGFVIGEDGRCGCSPDALVGDNAGLEIKCPFPQTHLKYLDYGQVPPEYHAQVQGSLFVTGRERWHFMSYHRKLPPLIVTVERDEDTMAKIGACLAKFNERFDAAFQRLASRA